MWNKELARREGRPLTSRNHTRPIPHVVPHTGRAPALRGLLKIPRFVKARELPGLQTHNRTRVTNTAEQLEALPLGVCPETSHLSEAPEGVGRAEASETGASLPCLPQPPAPPADSRGASLGLLSGPDSQAPAHIPTGRTFRPEQAFVSGSKLAEGSGAQGRGGGASRPQRHDKGPPHLMSCDPHLVTEKQRWKGTQEIIHSLCE